jgi:excisionase family DNA binding protein
MNNYPGQPPDFPDLLTVTEVARMLRVSRMTVHRLIRAEKLPALKVGARSWRVPRDAVIALLDKETPT